MARQAKKGLLYFNLDCEQEDNLNFIEAKHGIVGYGVVVKIWKKIYQFHGYYCEWNDKNIYLFAREINVDIKVIREIVETCFEEKIFSRDQFNENQVLTSSGVQKRWKKIVIEAKRKDIEIEAKYAIISNTPEKTPIIPVEYGKTSEQMAQSKGKENKENKTPQSEGEGISTVSLSVAGNQVFRKEESSLSSPIKSSCAVEKDSQDSTRSFRPGYVETQHYFIQTTRQFWNQAIAKSQANLFLSYYEANGWIQNRSKPIINWKAAAYAWIQRELNGAFKVNRSNFLNKISEIQTTAKDNIINNTNVKADVEYLYAAFLEEKLHIEQIEAGYYDYLKENQLINFSKETISQIKEQARKCRMESLIGTNQAKFTRIYLAYEANASGTDPEIKNDVCAFNKIAKRLAVMEFFRQLKVKNAKLVFNN